ncbi:unnamed protein product, partial [Staurois parvus]
MSAQSCDQLCPITADHMDIYTDHQGSGDQCALMISVAPAVPCASATSMPNISAYQCTSVPNISAHLSCLSVPPISAMYQCCLSVMLVNAHQCHLPVPPHQCHLSVSIS